MARELVIYETHFWDFYHQQPTVVKEKIDYVLSIIREHQQVPVSFLKHLEGTKGLYEVRVQALGNNYRIFCFFDAGKLVILLTAFQKKTQKTPPKEIEKALKLKAKYESEKQH